MAPVPFAGWHSIAEVAESLNCSPRTVRVMISQGELEAVRIGPRMIRINPESLAQLARPLTPLSASTLRRPADAVAHLADLDG